MNPARDDLYMDYIQLGSIYHFIFYLMYLKPRILSTLWHILMLIYKEISTRPYWCNTHAVTFVRYTWWYIFWELLEVMTSILQVLSQRCMVTKKNKEKKRPNCTWGHWSIGQNKYSCSLSHFEYISFWPFYMVYWMLKGNLLIFHRVRLLYNSNA